MKAKQNHLTILGTGTSTGTPQLGCRCSVCTSNDTHDKRLRTSLLIKTQNNKTIIIDTTPDMRTQLLHHHIFDVDGAIITHDHADHIHGIDDLRPFCFTVPSKKIPILASSITSKHLKERFPYIFKSDQIFNELRPILGGGIPLLFLEELALSTTKITRTNFLNEELELFVLPHGHTFTTAVYHQGFLYIPDCSEIDQQIIDQLLKRKIDFLIIDCLQPNPHETHLDVTKAFNYIEKLNPKKAGLIHMNHHLRHNELKTIAKKRFPKGNVFPLADNDQFDY